MTLPRLRAVEFMRRMTSGRSRPGLFRCESEDGQPKGDYVVKLRADLEGGAMALAFEAVAAMMARRLGLSTPDPAIVEIDSNLADAVEVIDSAAADAFRRSTGSNFGSKLVTGKRTWGSDEMIPTELRESALEVLAFDALLQNPDRRKDNPNLLVGADEMYLIDHEVAFSFLYDVGPADEPWKVGTLGFLRDHVFYRRLKRRGGSLDRFRGKLAALADEDIEAMVEVLPPAWREDRLDRVTDHIKAVRDHADEFVEQVEGVLG